MRFQVFKNGKILNKFALCGTYLFGTDGIAIRRAQITFEDGIIECKKPNSVAAGLSLLWPIEGYGKVLLPTTCLPENGRLYNLNIELARAKLMQIITKREEWSLFNDTGAASTLSTEAQALFIQALQNISNPPLASKLADESLKKAVVLSEQLAANHAKLLFDRRGKSRGFGRACLGCGANQVQLNNPKYIERFQELFNLAIIPTSWAFIEVEKEHYDFSKLDMCVNSLTRKRLAIGIGPVLCFSKEHLPKWLLDGGAEFETIRDNAYKFVTQLVSRYCTSVRVWLLLGGLNTLNYFGFSFAQVLEMTRSVCLAAKMVGERTIRIVQINNPWGEYYATMANTTPPVVYADMLIQSGVNFDAFALQMQFGRNLPGMHARDMMHISAILDHFAQVGKPLYITNLAIPSGNTDVNECESAGIWHSKWDQTSQSQWMEQFYKTALSKPFVETIIYSDLTDQEKNPIANSGLVTKLLEPRKSFHTIKKIKQLIFNR